MTDGSHSNLPPLPLGWTENIAPTGHTYFYNTETKESTYRRPTGSVLPDPTYTKSQQHWQTSTPYIRLSDPKVANAFISRHSKSLNRGVEISPKHPTRRSQPEHKTPRQPTDKPVSKIAIPGHEPWILILTKFGRRFVHNSTKNTSYWRIPDKLKPAILGLDRARILKNVLDNKAHVDLPASEPHDAEYRDALSMSKKGDPDANLGVDEEASTLLRSAARVGYSDSEYEVVEMSEDGEDDESGVYGNVLKRQKMEYADGPTEFGEDDMAFQLQAAAVDSGGPGTDGIWEVAEDNVESSDDDAPTLFRALLDDFNINPYSSWEKIIEEGNIIDDPRYIVLKTMKSRKNVWEDWSKARIKELKEKKSTEEKVDPLLSYLSLLQRYATPRLFWPEFKRKYKKEAEIRELSLSDKEKEKWYRDFVTRLKLPQATLKSDFTELLNSIPASDVKENALPRHLITDIRYVSLDEKVRQPLLEAYLQTVQRQAT